jgi:hypothetical protein
MTSHRRAGVVFPLLLALSQTCLVASELGQSVVTIYANNKSESAQGTGFVLGQGGRIVTAYHVIQSATSIEIRDAAFKSLGSVVIEFIDPKRDVAILKSPDAEDLPGLKISSTGPPANDEIKVAGSPRGLPKQVLFGRLTSNGTISSLALSSAGGRRIFAEDIEVYPVDVTIYSGMSGAAVVGSNGTVIGILSGSFDEGRGIAWCIPIKYAIELMQTSAMNKRPDQMPIWPELSLMKASWISLRRSYRKPFSPEHIAKLEILEAGLRNLRGRWSGTANEKQLIADNPLNGRCEKLTHRGVEISFDMIDQENAVIHGRVRQKVTEESRFRAAQYTTDDQNEIAEGICNAGIFGDKEDQSADIMMKGALLLDLEDEDDISEQTDVFGATLDVSDCDGSLCSADTYGEHDAGRLEILSDEKIRWGSVILRRQ